MKTGMIFVLIAAGFVFAGAARAQTYDSSSSPVPSPLEVSGSNNWSGDTHHDAPVWMRDRLGEGINAMKSGDYAAAEKAFAYALRAKPNNAEINLYMGVTRMNLGQWEAAKQNLKVATNRDPRHPDPKSRLGVTYAKLGDAVGARAQREELVRMAHECRDTCRMSPFISEGIRMIDEALAEESARG